MGVFNYSKIRITLMDSGRMESYQATAKFSSRPIEISKYYVKIKLFSYGIRYFSVIKTSRIILIKETTSVYCEKLMNSTVVGRMKSFILLQQAVHRIVIGF
jgi:hypothetical protein